MFAEPIIQINSSRTHWSSSTRSRILEFAQTGLRDPLSFLKHTHLEPFSALIPFADRHGIHLQRNPHPLNSSTPPTPLIPIIHAHSEHWPTAQTAASHSDPAQILLYGTCNGSIIGWALVFMVPTLKMYHWARGSILLPPNSFLNPRSTAQYGAALAAITHFSPGTVTLYTTNGSLLQNMTETLTERQRLRHSCRPVLALLHHFGGTEFSWNQISPPTHLPQMSTLQLLVASTHAQRGANHPTPQTIDLTQAEPTLLLYINGYPVHNDYRKALRTHLWSSQISQWAQCPRQGLIPRYLSEKTLPFLASLRKLLPRQAWVAPWFIDSLCSNFPCAKWAHTGTQVCPLCTLDIVDDYMHYFHCPRTHHLLQPHRKSVLRCRIP